MSTKTFQLEKQGRCFSKVISFEFIPTNGNVYVLFNGDIFICDRGPTVAQGLVVILKLPCMPCNTTLCRSM